MGPVNLLLLGLLLSSFTVQGNSNCPSTWYSIQLICVQIFKEQLTWEEAKTACQKQVISGKNAQLAIFARDAKLRLLATAAKIQHNDLSGIWISLRGPQEGDNLHWSDGTEVIIKRWKGGQPKNMKKDSCVYLPKTEAFKNLDIADCNEKKAYACYVDFEPKKP